MTEVLNGRDRKGNQDLGNKMVTDDHLMCRFQEGDESAFKRLLERYQDRIMNYVFRIVGDYDTAVDITQEAFIRVYMNAGRYLPGSRFAPWLYRIASNLAINEIRRRKRWRFFSFDEPINSDEKSMTFELPDESILSPEANIIQKEDVESVEQALEKIPVKYRTPLILREIEGYDYEEISKILNIPRGTVKSRLNRGRSLLKTALYRQDKSQQTAFSLKEE
ncbi:sigma-70 family RNA polymerase sigma factor [bacterium]|nr:sigma-70 family RNA polymerase sigma factor [candidate division CSSED10-310 bacterium]